MKKEIKDKWVEALRSGKYKQGSGQLRQDDCFCCLGVLCDIYIKTTNTGKWEPILNSEGQFVFSVNKAESETGVLTESVSSWSGLGEEKSGNPSIKINGVFHSTLASLNDNGISFKKIADLIEKQL